MRRRAARRSRRLGGWRSAGRWRRAPGEYRWAEVGGYRVHWVEAGAGEPLVLVHGLCGSARWWGANLPALAAHYRVLAVDVLGFGRSRCPGPLPDLPAVADVVAEWMRSVRAAPGAVVGHSMGGHLAVHLAARHPEAVSRLVLADAAGLPRPFHPAALARWVYEVAPPRRWGHPGFLPVIWGDAWAAGPRTTVRALRNIMRDDVRPLLAGLRVPTLVLWGEGDTIVPLEHAERYRRLIPGARLAVIPGAFHNPMVDRPEAFNRAVLDFLADVPA